MTKVKSEKPANAENKLPNWFWAVGIAALIWNLLGMAAFFIHINITPEILADMTEGQRSLYENSPEWMVAVFAVAVDVATLGSIALLLKSKWTVPLFAVSFICVVIQHGYSLLLTNAIEIMGAQAVIMPLLIIVIAATLLWLSMDLKRRKVLL